MWSQKILNRREFADLLASMDSNSSRLTSYSSAYAMDSSRVLTILAYSILFVVGLGGNAWVAYVIAHVLRQPRRESSSCVQIYILALCLGDFIILTFSLFLIMDLAYNAWIIESVFLCRLYLSSESLNKFYVPFVLVSLSYFCYAKICRPVPQERSKTNRFSDFLHSIINGSTRSAICLTSLCAVSAFVLCAPVYAYGDLHYLVFDAVINDSSKMTTRFPTMMVMPKCAFSPPTFLFNAFTVYSFVGGFAIPASLFTYFYSAILWQSSRRRQRQSVVRLGVSATSQSNGHKSQFWRVAKTASGLVSFYLLCWTPYWAVNLYHAWSPMDVLEDDADNRSDLVAEVEEESQSDVAVVFGYFIHMLPYINCTGYPILYTLLNRQIIETYKMNSRGRQATNGRDSITRSSIAVPFDSSKMRSRCSSRQNSGNSQLLCVNSSASMVALNGDARGHPSLRQQSLSNSLITAV